MSRTVTALYDTRSEAEAARKRLDSEVSLGDARVLDEKTSLDSFPLSDEDRHAYREAMRRGGFMLVAEVRGHEDPDRIIQLLEDSAIDLDERQDTWRSEGWAPHSVNKASGAAAASDRTGPSVAEVRVPIIEEQLVVGKREVERGHARVRSYVREVPVHEQVTLHDEHVDVERRRVDKPIGEGELDRGDLLRERNVEFRAVGEEPVVRKEAHIREEVVMRKTTQERPQQVHDTVARTEVDLGEGSSAGGSAATSNRGASESAGGRDVEPPRPTDSLATGQPGHTSRPETMRDTGSVAVERVQPELVPEFEETRTFRTTERRSRAGPSRKLVLGSAVAGALVGGALPFMLGRKSRSTDVVVLEEERLAASDREETDWRREPAADTRWR